MQGKHPAILRKRQLVIGLRKQAKIPHNPFVSGGFPICVNSTNLQKATLRVLQLGQPLLMVDPVQAFLIEAPAAPQHAVVLKNINKHIFQSFIVLLRRCVQQGKSVCRPVLHIKIDPGGAVVQAGILIAVLFFHRFLYIVKQPPIVCAPCGQRMLFGIESSFQNMVQLEGMVILQHGEGIVQKMK